MASRSYSDLLPIFISKYAGDTLWALMVFLLIGFIFPYKSSFEIAIIALIFSFSIELSQLYHAPWIDNIRQYRLGGLILGYSFIWSDLVCYSMGIMMGILGEKIIRKI
ncbi:MAG: DUF2809 domain-containing protein [Candidatus Marithrix sp.]|nr:DUF2809 domain-containing protein [Candidatus Marithrix sp.]